MKVMHWAVKGLMVNEKNESVLNAGVAVIGVLEVVAPRTV